MCKYCFLINLRCERCQCPICFDAEGNRPEDTRQAVIIDSKAYCAECGDRVESDKWTVNKSSY